MNNKIVNCNFLKRLFLLGVFAIITFVFLLNSPMHPWVDADANIDSAVFRTIGMDMTKGLMPYKDTFDHKGPLLYLINYFGALISSYRGTFVFEFLSMFVSLLFMYLIAELLHKKTWESLFIVILSVSPLFNYFEGGNFTEEYAIPFILIAIYIFLKILLLGTTSWYELVLCGVSFACVICLRINMFAVWVVFIPSIIILNLRKKNYSSIFRMMGGFLLGIAIVIIPIIIWLSWNDSLLFCWNDYILFNLTYVDGSQFDSLFGAQLRCMLGFLRNGYYLSVVSFGIMFYTIVKKKRVVDIIYCIYMVVNLFLICMSGYDFPHYGMTIIPVFTYPLTIFFLELSEFEKKYKIHLLTLITHILFIILIIFPAWKTTIYDFPANYKHRNNEKKSERVLDVTDYILKSTDTDDTISVYGNWNVIYLVSNRQHATKYSYQFPIGKIDKNIMDDYWKQMEEELPKLIVLRQQYDEDIKSFLSSHDYILVFEKEYGDDEPVSIYQKI